ncbi:hypothetical protein JCM11641_001237 [Rhodosporidiobolus odoratus]
MEWENLVSTLRKTRGSVPPALVGASVTLIGDCIYVFGGRPVASREMVNTLYSLDLRTLSWTLLPSSPSTPSPRYFHSSTAWGEKLVLWGGQSFVPSEGAQAADEEMPGHLETLDELVIFDTRTQEWSTPPTTVSAGIRRPSPRYAHLAVSSTATYPSAPGFSQASPSLSSRLVIVGGQDFENNYLADLAVLDLDRLEWVSEAPYPRKAGSYRSVGATASVSVRPREEKEGMDGTLVHSSHSVEPTVEEPEAVFVFSNANFSNPRRDLDLIPSVHDQLITPAYLSLADLMSGEASLPPGLRFPHAYICGRHLVLSGAHIGVNRGELAVYSLNLGANGSSGASNGDKMLWSRIPVDKVLGTGSWGPAVGWKNTLVLVGDKSIDMLEGYNARSTSFAQVAFVDLEAYGIYNPPQMPLAPSQQTLGLLTLSQPQLFDYELICSDKERLGCSRKLLEARWPWFADELRAVEAKASAAVEAREQRTATSSGAYGDDTSDDEPMDTMQRMASSVQRSEGKSPQVGPARAPSRIFPITSHSLELPLPSNEAKALLQYFHILALSTPLQRSLPVLAALLAFTKTYEVAPPSLRALVVHVLHECLNEETAGKVYEAAALGETIPLQIRAMQIMMSPRQAPNPATLPPTRYSDHSIGSSRSSAQSADSHTSLTYCSSPDFPLPGTPTTSISSSSHSSSCAPHSPFAPPTSAPPLPPLPPIVSQLASPLPAPGGPPVLTNNTFLASRSSSSSVPSELPSHSPPLPSQQYSAASRPAPASTPPALVAASTPARIAETWRDGEERDRRQRAEAARRQAEADVSRLRIFDRKGSMTPSMASGSTEQSARAAPGDRYQFSPTPSISGLVQPADLDNISIRTTSTGGASSSTRQSSERAAAAAAAAASAASTAAQVTAKVAKKGFLGSILAQPTMHSGGTKGAAPAIGPPARKVYPAPRTRKQVEDEKKAAKKAASMSSGASVRS